MSGFVTVESTDTRPAPHRRALALLAIAVARGLARLAPRRLRRAMERIRGDARPATVAETRRARDAVVAASVRCAGPWCLQRSIATALLCRLHGAWPEWVTGVRVQPFQAHAWVAVEGEPVGESARALDGFRPVMTVRSRRGT